MFAVYSEILHIDNTEALTFFLNTGIAHKPQNV
jgi:hypothetical protein